MRRALALPFALLAFSGLPAQAALSGFYDSGEQIGMILGSEAVGNAVRQAPIGSISNTGTREDGAKEWTVRVQECDLKVYLKPILPDGPGMTTYEIEIPGACE